MRTGARRPQQERSGRGYRGRRRRPAGVIGLPRTRTAARGARRPPAGARAGPAGDSDRDDSDRDTQAASGNFIVGELAVEVNLNISPVAAGPPGHPAPVRAATSSSCKPIRFAASVSFRVASVSFRVAYHGLNSPSHRGIRVESAIKPRELFDRRIWSKLASRLPAFHTSRELRSFWRRLCSQKTSSH